MKIMISNICEAFEEKAVGSKVKVGYHKSFMKELEKAIKSHDFTKDRVPGQAVLTMSPTVNSWVSPGSYFRHVRPDLYIVRRFRGEVGLYMKRTGHMTCDNVSVVVYTKEAYLDDPDCDIYEQVEVESFFGKKDGYVLVAVLGNPSRVKSTVSYSRFVKNLAGANNEYAVMSKDELVDLAKKVVENRSNFVGVSD